MRWLLHSLLAMSVLTLSSCALFQSNGATEVPPRTFQPSAYIIGKGDNLQVDVWRNPELSRGVTVRPDGFVTMPLMGDLAAAGKRPEVLASEIADGLKRIIKSPEVTVTVNNPASIEYLYRVRAMGEVSQPVSLPYVDGMTVMDLVLAAGGVSPFGADKRAILSRMTKNGYQDFQVNLHAILNEGDTTTNFLLQPTDILTVPEKSFWRGEF